MWTKLNRFSYAISRVECHIFLIKIVAAGRDIVGNEILVLTLAAVSAEVFAPLFCTDF